MTTPMTTPTADATTITNTDAGTETQTLTAEAGGAPIQTPDAGAAPDSHPAEDGSNGEQGRQETAQADTEGNRDRGSHQTTLEERALQLAEKKVAEMQAAFEQKLQARAESEKLPFVSLDMDKINAHFQTQEDLISEMKLEGRFVEARRLQRELDELDASIIENDRKREEWQKSQTATTERQTQIEQRAKRIGESAEFYRTQKNIPQETWESAGKWLNEQFQSDPVLLRQFSEMIDRQGDMAAMAWADEYCRTHMGAKAKADRDAKEQGKENFPAGGGAPASQGKQVSSFNELMKLPSADINKFQKDNPAEFQRLKDAHFK